MWLPRALSTGTRAVGLLPRWCVAVAIVKGGDEHADGLVDGSCCLVVAVGRISRARRPRSMRAADAIDLARWPVRQPRRRTARRDGRQACPRGPGTWRPRLDFGAAITGFSQALDETGFSVPQSDGKQSIVFRGRYSRLIPLRIDQRGYLIVSAMDQAADGYVAVIKPLPSGGRPYRRRQQMGMLLLLTQNWHPHLFGGRQ